MVSVVVRRHSCNRTSVGPAVTLDVPIDIRDHTSLIVGVAGKKQDYVLLHLHAEIRPADTLWMNVCEQQQSGSQRRDNLGSLFKDGVVRCQAIVPMSSPTNIRIHRIAAQLGI